ncbi:MAG: DUF4834 family protein [Bacteroidia bacterium]|jgi:hypothetical protein|nr:DUF4834 family protein [Bacteroidia bacterium]
MQELFYTILVGWILWRILSPSRAGNAPSSGQYYYQQNTHHHHHNKDKVQPPQASQKGRNNDDGEYVDYEEIK